MLRYIEVGKREATLLCGGERLTAPLTIVATYVSPAIFADVTPEHADRARRNLRTGPRHHGSRRATPTPSPRRTTSEYGLSAAIATRNPRYMHDFARDIQSGTVKINRTTTGNLINAPFGGLKRSSTSTFRESGRPGSNSIPRSRLSIVAAEAPRSARVRSVHLFAHAGTSNANSFKLELNEARTMADAAIRKSEEIGVLETVCIVDDGGYPLLLVAHGSRPRHRAADRLEQGLYRGRS